jgi:hypothetical protein
MLPRPSESSVRPRNLQDPLAYLEQGLPLDGHNTHHRPRPQNQLNHGSRGAHDRDMYEKTHIRQRSGYLSPTLSSFPLPGGGPAGRNGWVGRLGIGNRVGISKRKGWAGRVRETKARIGSGGISRIDGKGQKGFHLAGHALSVNLHARYTRKMLICRDICSSSSRPVSD